MGILTQTHNGLNFLGTEAYIQADGSTKMTIKSNGKVGIGTTSPESTLHVYTASGQANIKVQSGGNDAVFFANASTNFGIWGFDNARLSLATNSTERVSITGGGNVGIGTTSPSYKLHVAGDVRADDLISSVSSGGTLWFTRPDNSVNTDNVLGVIKFGNSGDTGYENNPQSAIISGVASAAWSTTSTPSKLQFYTTAVDATTATERLIITSEGNVGIGTTSPQAKLHVDGSVRFEDLTGGILKVDGDGDLSVDTSTYLTQVPSEYLTQNEGDARYVSFEKEDRAVPNTGGWYRLAKISRGAGRFSISYTGGHMSPHTYVIDAFKNWNNEATIAVEKFGHANYITSFRISRADGAGNNDYYLEGYFSSITNTHSFEARFQEILGYNNISEIFAVSSSSTLVASTATDDETIESLTTTANEGLYLKNMNLDGRLNLYTDSNTTSTTALVLNGTEVEKRTLGSAAFSAATDFVAVTGDTMTGNLKFNDSVQARFGTGSDLRIYHDGSNSYIDDTGTGDLIIKGGNDIIFRDSVGNLLANMNESNSVELYYGGSKKFETTSYGTKITGGISSDGNAKSYTWRAVNNTTNTSAGYHKIARIYSSLSTRFVIEIAGRSTSYSDGTLPAMGYIVGQLNNDNNYDIIYYNHSIGTVEVVTEVGQVDVDSTQTDIYVKVGDFAEVTAHAHISDGSITVDSSLSGDEEPTNYVAATEVKVFNSGAAIPVANGGTGATTASGSRTNLGLGTAATAASTDFVAVGGDTMTGQLIIQKTGNFIAAKFKGTAANGYGQINVENDLGTGLILGSMGSTKTGTFFDNARYIGATSGELVLKTYSSTDGHMKFLSGGQNERMRIAAGGNIGINTTNPTELLELNRDGKIGFGANGDYGIRAGYFDDTGGVHGFHIDTKHGGDWSTRRFVVRANSGNVGIGTDSPNAKLEVRSDGSAASGAEIRLQHANNNSTDVVSTLNFANNAGSVAMIQAGTTGANNTGYISFFTDNAGTSSEKMRILGNGNVGIGTSNPMLKLDVRGYVVFQQPSGSQVTQFLDSSGDGLKITAWNNGANIDPAVADDNIYFGRDVTLGNLLVQTGNVGIGTTGPGAKLHVNGDVIRVVNSTFAGIESHNTNGTWESFVGTESGGGGNRYNSASSQHTFYNNSAAVMRINSSGNVGINTTNISGQEGAANGTPKLQVLKTGTTGSYDLVARFGTDQDENNSGASVLINAGNDRGLLVSAGRADSNRAIAHLNLIQYDGNELTDGLTIYQPSAGSSGATSGTNVGIGTTTPSQKLDVNGITTSKGFQTYTTNVDYNLLSRNNGGNATLYVQAATTTANQPIAQFSYGSSTANAGAKVLLVAKDKTYFANTNVGIGTTDPAEKLHVAGNVKATGWIGRDSDNYITFDETNNYIDFYAGGNWVARMESDGDLHVKGDVIAFSDIFNP